MLTMLTGLRTRCVTGEMPAISWFYIDPWGHHHAHESRSAIPHKCYLERKVDSFDGF
jgi:hypothetical protein